MFSFLLIFLGVVQRHLSLFGFPAPSSIALEVYATATSFALLIEFNERHDALRRLRHCLLVHLILFYQSDNPLAPRRT